MQAFVGRQSSTANTAPSVSPAQPAGMSQLRPGRSRTIPRSGSRELAHNPGTDSQQVSALAQRPATRSTSLCHIPAHAASPSAPKQHAVEGQSIEPQTESRTLPAAASFPRTNHSSTPRHSLSEARIQTGSMEKSRDYDGKQDKGLIKSNPVLSSPRVRQAPVCSGLPLFLQDTIRSRSEPLAQNLRDHFSPFFRDDFQDVRIHRGVEARAASFALGAKAFAVGNDIVWPSTAPGLHTMAGRRLLAHELTHVMQQRAGSSGAIAAGGALSETEAQASVDAYSLQGSRPRLTATRPGLALSIDDYRGKSPNPTSRSYSQLIEDIDQIQEWMDRQTHSTPESVNLEIALQQLKNEVDRRTKNTAQKSIKTPRAGKGGGTKPQGSISEVPGSDDRPRVLIDRASQVYKDAADRKDQLDRIVDYLQRPGLSKGDRDALRGELRFLAPGFEQDRAQQAGDRKSQIIHKAIGMPSGDNTAQLLDALRRIDGIRPLDGAPGIQYMMKGDEIIRMSDKTVAELRGKTSDALARAADKARSMNEYTFGRAKDFVKVNDENRIVGFVVTNWSGLSPYDMWDRVLNLVQDSNMDVTRFRAMAKSQNASLASEALQVLQAVEMAQHARAVFNETFDGAMDAADQIVNGLKVIVEVTASIELALVAAVAAPIVAAGAAGLGATGAGAGAITIAGTSGVTASAGAVIGYSSTRLEGGSEEQARANARKKFKQGAVTGLGASTTQVLGSALRVGATGLSTADRLARGTLSQAGGNFVANATGTAIEGGGLVDSVKSGGLGVATALIAAPLGAAANSIENPGLRVAANMATSGGVAYGTTYALTGDSGEASQSALTAAATAGVTTLASPPNGPSWGQKKAFEAGRGIRTTSRNVLVAATLGVGNPNLPFKGTGGSSSSIILAPEAGVVSGPTSSPQATASFAMTTPAGEIVAPSATTKQVSSTSGAAPATPVPVAAGLGTQVAGLQTAGAIAQRNSSNGPGKNQNAPSDVDRAFAEDAQHETSEMKAVPLRQRTTKSGKQQSSLETLPLTPTQRQAVKVVAGRRLSGQHLARWNAASNPQEVRDMAEVSRLWSLGTPAEKQQARDLARDVFDRHVGRFWGAMRSAAQPSNTPRSSGLNDDFTAAGMRYDLTKSGAPRYVLPTGEQTGMTLDHNVRLSDDPTQALNGNNLSFVLDDENSVTLEAIRNQDPFQR